MRKYAREVAFSLVFEYMFTKAFNEMELEQFDKNNLTDEDLDFIKKLYKGVVGAGRIHRQVRQGLEL